ncbi:DUF947-domain-containing protein [Pluteus cervinus]|uniref:DUF947-domain-containing protein n=1 Tax=Pluteus cervinus TaxID=181527 RepID=A0ACD3BG97_9AGAR|nr:DUF947-domain-containing protein [Pluteus cervinus]
MAPKRKFTDYSEGDSDQDVDALRISQWIDDEELEMVPPVDVEEEIEDELSTLPLGMLRRAQKSLNHNDEFKRDGSPSGSSSASSRSSSPKRGAAIGDATKSSKPTKRSNKHAPMEVTSKRPVPRKRQIVDVKTYESRDPRFMSISGEFSDQKFQEQYKFLKETRQSELASLRENLKRARKLVLTSPRDQREEREREVEKLALAVKRAESQVNRDRTAGVEQEALRAAKGEEQEKRKQGKGSWYMKKGEQKKLLVKAKYDALSAEGGSRAVKKAITKKEKKLGQKDKKSRPRTATGSSQGQTWREAGHPKRRKIG